MSVDAMSSTMLEGLTIVSLEQYGAGPFATMLLADLGADVIKIEDRSSGGDVGRSVPPFVGDADSLYFQSLNRRKRSVALNMREPRGREVFEGLVGHADAVFNNLRGDQPAIRGLDYASLKQCNPRIVCCHLSGYGRSGKRAAEPAYDYIMQGRAGWMSITGEPDGPPTKSGLSMVDLSAGALMCVGLLGMVTSAQKTGVGGDVDVSLFETALSMLTYVGTWQLTRDYEARRWSHSSHPSQVPSQILPTKDGWIAVMVAKEKFFPHLVEALGMPELATDERFCNFEGRLQHREILVEILERASREYLSEDLISALTGKIPIGPVRTVAQALQDPELEESGMILSFDHPQFGAVRSVRGAIRTSRPEPELTRAPRLGENTQEILADVLELSAEEVDELSRMGIIS